VNKVVLDASALLALLNEEDGAEKVGNYLGYAEISAVNLSEVIAKLNEYGVPDETILTIINELGIECIPFDRDNAFKSGFLRKKTKSKNISFGDRACLALALLEGLPVITCDKAWESLDLPVEIRIIR
jgi:PIN domain nuclease of toxin-antitoxin system